MEVKTFVFCFVLWWTACAAEDDTPGLQIKPVPKNGVIYYNVSDEGTRRKHQEELETFLKPYNSPTVNPNHIIVCSATDERRLEDFCDFNVKDLYMCDKNYGYGYGERARGFCIFVKLDDVLNWKPKIYQNKDLPKTMPEKIKKQIADNDWAGTNYFVYLSCEGKSDQDKTYAGPINYYPINGFASYYFPYTSVKGYLSPLVAIHIERPQQGVDISIRCKAWAQNIADNQAITDFKISMF